MIVRLYEPEDYEMVRGWWIDWGKAPLHPACLPKIGAIVEVDGDAVCAAWLYQTDSKLAWVEGCISNRNARKRRKEALSLLADFLCAVATKRGFAGVTCAVNNRHLAKVLRECGFTGEESNITTMGKSLCH